MGLGCVIIYSSCHAPSPNHLLNELNSLFNYTGLQDHYTETSGREPPALPQHPLPRKWEIITEKRNFRTQFAISQQALLCACKSNTLHEGDTKTISILPQQRMHFGTQLKAEVTMR